FTIALSPRGEILRVEGYDDLLKKLAGEDAALQKGVQALLSEETVRQSLAEAFSFLPDKPVKPQDQWERKQEIALGPLGHLSFKRSYTYDSREKVGGKELDRITFTAATTYQAPKAGDANAPLQVAQGKIEADDFGGTITFDAAAGRLVQLEMEMKLKGTLLLTVNGSNVATETQQTQTVKIRLLDKKP